MRKGVIFEGRQLTIGDYLELVQFTQRQGFDLTIVESCEAAVHGRIAYYPNGPVLQDYIEAYLIPDLAKIVMSYVNTYTRINKLFGHHYDTLKHFCVRELARGRSKQSIAFDIQNLPPYRLGVVHNGPCCVIL